MKLRLKLLELLDGEDEQAMLLSPGDDQPALELVAELRGQDQTTLVIELWLVCAQKHRVHLPLDAGHHFTPLPPTSKGPMGVFCRRRSYASRENHGGGQLYPSPHIFVEALRLETENDASNRLFSGRRRARGAKRRRPRGAKWRPPRGAKEARRRRSREGERPYRAKQDGPAGERRTGVEQGEATAWNKARRRRGAWHGDAVERSGRRMGAPQRIASMRSSMPMPHEQGGRFARSTRRQERV